MEVVKLCRMKKYLKIFYDAGTIAFHYTILYSLYSVASASPSCFEAHVGLFRLLMKEIFDAYVQGPPTHIDAFQTNIFS